MQEIEPRERKFSVTVDDIRAALIDRARKGKKNIADAGHKVEFNPDSIGLVGATVTLKLAPEQSNPPIVGGGTSFRVWGPVD